LASILLSSVKTETKAKILFILWRAWHIRNDVVHEKGTPSINGSCKFLTSYAESLGLTGTPEAPGSNDKGKGKLAQDSRGNSKCRQGVRLAPKEGWIKLNTDTGFVADTGVASAGIV
jgi:hypothetical protein